MTSKDKLTEEQQKRGMVVVAIIFLLYAVIWVLMMAR